MLATPAGRFNPLPRSILPPHTCAPDENRVTIWLMARRNELAHLFKALSSGKVKAVYAVVGKDPGLRAELVSRIRTACLGAEGNDGNAVVFGPPDPARPSSAPTTAQVMDEARTPSLFSGRKFILVREAGHLVSGKSAGGGRAVAEYVEAAVPGTVLVLELEKLDKRTALAKALARTGGLVETPRLYSSRYGETEPSMESSMGTYLRQLAADRGVKITASAGCRLLELADGEAGVLGAELDKLAEFLRKKERAATVEDVDRLTSRGASQITPLVRHALAGSASRALVELERVYARGMDSFGRVVWDEAAISIAVVSALARELRQVERTRMNGGRCPTARSGKSLPPQVARPVEEAARRFDAEKLERAYRQVLEADLALKSSSGRAPRTIVHELLVGLGLGEKPASARHGG